jgi:hypothetical protein
VWQQHSFLQTIKNCIIGARLFELLLSAAFFSSNQKKVQQNAQDASVSFRAWLFEL